MTPPKLRHEACLDKTDLPAMLRIALQAGKPNGKIGGVELDFLQIAKL